MKRVAIVLFVLSVLVLGACSNNPGFKDGIYFAQADNFDERTGWKYMVTLEVEDGKVVSAEWNGANVDAGMDKISLSKAGKYPMVKAGGAQADWHVQSKAVEDYFLETQSPEQPDSISGATIHINDFFDLAKKALDKGPVGYGPYKDGTYHAEEAEFSHGYKYFVDITVISGYIVAANWDGYAQGDERTKQQISMDGDYGMVEKGGAQAPWWEQARAVEEYLLSTQDPSQPDAISGATIGLEPFYSLVNEALKGAKK